MLPIAYRRTIKNLIVVSAVGLSALFTFIAVFDVPSAQADHHVHVQPAAANDTHLAEADHHEHTQPAAAIDPSSAQVDQQSPAQPTSASGIADVSIAGSRFNPSIITITAGSSVRWTNADPFTHTTTSDIGSLDPWDSGHLGPGQSFTKTFNTPGNYAYHCAIHFTFMFGTVVVLSSAPQPPTSVSVNGPALSEVNTSQMFTATVDPITATQPITFVWEATGQSPMVHTGDSPVDTASFTWPTGMTGTAHITATAMNEGGAASGAFTTTLIPQVAPISDVSIAGPFEGAIDTAYAFTATVSPLTATLPITYSWQATGQSPITHTGGDLSDTIMFTWISGTTGTQLITATATNDGGMAVGTHVIIFNALHVYLPLVLKSLAP